MRTTDGSSANGTECGASGTSRTARDELHGPPVSAPGVARFMRAEGGPKLVHACQVCGRWASFGFNVSLLDALKMKDPERAGRWYCGDHRPHEA